MTDEAVKFISENNPKISGKPFFLYLAHHAVHTPIQAKNEITKKYEEKEGETCQWVLDGGREKIATNNSVELYNIKNDIGETKNLCNVEVEKRNELLNELLIWQKETGAKIPNVANKDFIP